MKKGKIIVGAVLLSVWIVGPLFGQNKTGSPINPNLHEISMGIRNQMRQIRKDSRSGKLIPAQAKAALANLKSIRQMELQYFHQNGGKEISLQQKDQLEKMLGQNNPI
jgi:hypothetical protein